LNSQGVILAVVTKNPIRAECRRMSGENPLWGAPRVHVELLKLGIEVAQSTVAKYMAKHRPGGSGQTWKTFLRNHAAGIGAMDFLVVPTINFRLLSVLVTLRHERRRLISVSVTDHPTAEWIAQQITEAFPWDEAPTHLIRDVTLSSPLTKTGVSMALRGCARHELVFRFWLGPYPAADLLVCTARP
jgi:hypothetical protein